MVKLAVVVTVRVTVVDCCSPPPLPVTTMLYVPAAVPPPTARVSVELPPPGAEIGLGLKVADVPDGTPVADSKIALLNPPLTAVVMVETPEFP